eukprot:673598-Rhodomonas_salina.2
MDGSTTTSARATAVITGAKSKIGRRPMASASLPKELENMTSANAEADPICPRRIAMAAGSMPAVLRAGGSVVPIQPKHALCSPTTSISSGVGGGALLSASFVWSSIGCPGDAADARTDVPMWAWCMRARPRGHIDAIPWGSSSRR